MSASGEKGLVRGAVAAGAVLRVPDYLWGLVNPARVWHPGACTTCSVEANRATMLKGQGAESIPRAYRRRYFLVRPTPSNGLDKPTAFELAPRRLKLRPLVLRAAEHTMGALDERDFVDLQRALLRSIGRE